MHEFESKKPTFKCLVFIYAKNMQPAVMIYRNLEKSNLEITDTEALSLSEIFLSGPHHQNIPYQWPSI